METELKLELAPGDVPLLAKASILREAGRPKRRQLVSTYFDTADGALRRAGFSLRVRAEGARRTQTVKAEGVAAGLFLRPEWERRIEGEEPVIGGADGAILAVIGHQSVQPRFVTHVTRTEHVVTWEGATIEAALDLGEIRAGAEAAPFAELELELRDGPVAALFTLARALGEVAPLRLSVASKAERGEALGGAKVKARKAAPVMLDPDGDVAQAFAAICSACLKHFRLNEAILLAGDMHPTPLHQARVGLRRLRSALSLFRPILKHDPATARFFAGLKALAGALGEVRDLDVLIETQEGAVRDRLIEARVAAFETACATLDAAATRRLMLDLAEWLIVGAWRTAPAAAERVGGEIGPFAADLLERRRKRVKRQGADLASLGAHDRHQVRIEAKKLRYAAEFFAGLWTRKKARRRHEAFSTAIEALQEELGRLNDAAHGPAVLARLGLEGAFPPIKEGRILARAEAAFEALIASKRFWR